MSLFTSLEARHSTTRRVRLAYSAKRQFDSAALERFLRHKKGFVAVRVSPLSRSIAVVFDSDLISRQKVIDEIARVSDDIPDRKKNDRFSYKPIAQALLGFGAAMLLPPPLKTAATLFACSSAIWRGGSKLVSDGVVSETMEAAAILISIARKDFVAAHTTNTLIAISQSIEDSISRRSDEMLLSLIAPSGGAVWVKNGENERQISADDLTIGDRLVAYAGDTIEADGTVLSGEAMVNEASMTGESVAARKERGSRVLSSTVVEEGRIEIYAEAVGRERVAFRIGERVRSSLNAKSLVQLNAARLADRLIPTTIALSAFAYLFSGNFGRVAAILQADYSCALKLATPVAFKSSMFRGGKNGILIKSAQSLEKLAAANCFIFDKTGTLTRGELEVKHTISLNDNWSKEALLQLAASIEEHYFHPIAQAVVEAARKTAANRHFRHGEVEFITAHGVFAFVGGKKVTIGSRHYLEEDEGIDFAKHDDMLDKYDDEGLIPLFVGYDRDLLGIIWLKDELRSESAALIKRLSRHGKTVMLTGDRRARALDLARELAMDECRFELTPEQKATITAGYRAIGETTAFVGDGINDALALTKADVGIAMCHGSDIARISADITLLRDDIMLVASSKELALRVMRKVNNGYRLTVFANSLILGAAAFGMISPALTALLHNGVTIGVIANASRG
ncbi:MAG: heavy metal translocating P-type ATPase [Helicobacteraceae bacterium]|jgi:heavy metal translocating P-type ATPase|nr:heavy metal translocating P-type ATPase [Helicobacteraceae bacterium]